MDLENWIRIDPEHWIRIDPEHRDLGLIRSTGSGLIRSTLSGLIRSTGSGLIRSTGSGLIRSTGIRLIGGLLITYSEILNRDLISDFFREATIFHKFPSDHFCSAQFHAAYIINISFYDTKILNYSVNFRDFLSNLQVFQNQVGRRGGGKMPPNL